MTAIRERETIPIAVPPHRRPNPAHSLRRLWTTIGLVAAFATFGLALASPAGAALPGSMASLGDSLTRAFGAGGASGDYPNLSWSTGSDSSVGSHYLRLLAQNAAISGQNHNDSQEGANMAAVYGAGAGQAAAAVAQNPST